MTVAASVPTRAVTRVADNGSASAHPIPPEFISEWKAERAPGERLKREARELFAAGKYGEAKAKCREALAMFDGSVLLTDDVRPLLGDILLAQGKYRGALDAYDFTRHKVATGTIDRRAAFCYARLGDYTAAKRFYSDSVSLQYGLITSDDLQGTADLQSLEASIQVGRALDASFHGEGKTALRLFGEVIKLRPDDGLAYFGAGMSLDDSGRFREARLYFARAAAATHRPIGVKMRRWARLP